MNPLLPSGRILVTYLMLLVFYLLDYSEALSLLNNHPVGVWWKVSLEQRLGIVESDR